MIPVFFDENGTAFEYSKHLHVGIMKLLKV
jgi:hypothetical protein